MLLARARLIRSLGPKMSDADFAASFVRYFLEGAQADSWAALELNLLATYGNEMR